MAKKTKNTEPELNLEPTTEPAAEPTTEQKGGERGRPRKYDYDGDNFYYAIEALATRGYYDKEIADEMHLEPDVFSTMKVGRYRGWTKEENERRSKRIRETLDRARRKTNSLIRSTYLKMALGAKKIVNVVRRYVEDRCECGGRDPQCPYCGGTGKVVTEKAIVQETEAEMPPNMQALAMWLHHHDPEWVKGEAGATESINIEETHTGIDIDKWIEGMAADKSLIKEQRDAIKENENPSSDKE